MLAKVRRMLTRLCAETSGNVLFMVAAGMPALIGSAGLAVDVSQWYLWKQEVQHSVDQAALAAAWARAIPASEASYRDCQDFRVWAGIMGKKESHYVPTQGTGDTG